MPLDAVVMVRFPSQVRDALKAAASEQRRSMSNLMLTVLEAWLVEQGRLPPPKAPRRTRRPSR